MDWTGREFELRIDSVGHGGVFVGRAEGRVVFVRRTLPGERVRVRVTEDKGGSFCRAEVLEVLEAAPDRVEDACPAASRHGAGCCDLSHVAPAAQRLLKQEVLAQQLERVARLPRRVPVVALPGSGDGTGWRTRVRLAVDADGAAGYRRYRGSGVVTDPGCPQVAEGVLDGIAAARWLPGAELTVVLDDDGRRHIVETAPPRTTRGARSGGGRRATAARRAAGAERRPERVVEGGGSAVQRVDGREWRLAPTGFWQAHRAAAQAYSDLVREWTEQVPGAVAWDLYGGAGVFAAVLAERTAGGRVEVVESSAQSVRDGRDALAGLPGVRFHHARVEAALPRLAEEGGAPAVVVLDPPRSGAGRAVVAGLAQAGAARVIHAGCDPAAFARDLALYTEHGYRVEELRAWDGFPMTHHFESFALLVR